MLKKSREKKGTIANGRTSIVMQGGIVVILLVVVLLIVVYSSFSNNKKAAVAAVHDKFILQSADCANSMKNILSVTSASANAIAGIMSEEDNLVSDDIIRYAEKLKMMQPNCYMVVIADQNGVGYTSDGEKVDISRRDYFSTSNTENFFLTKNDGVHNQEACVIAVPYYKKNVQEGNVYVFVSTATLQEYLAYYYEYVSNVDFAMCDSMGNLLSSFDSSTAFLKEDMFIENLKEATMLDMQFARVETKIKSQDAVVFSAQLNEEERTIVSVPIQFHDCQFVTILEKAYVDKLISNDWSGVRELTVRLVLIAILFVGVILVMVLTNRMQYKRRSKELADKADTDLLTELNNKIATERKIQEYIEANPDSQCMFFLFDIDNFKKINDTLGHAFGDEVLRSLGQQLKSEFRTTDIIGRTGGDEFILFLKDLKSEDILEKEAIRLEKLFQDFKAGEYVKYSATASIGVAVYPRDAKDYQGMYKTADKALYEAKRRGKNCLVFYNTKLKEKD